VPQAFRLFDLIVIGLLVRYQLYNQVKNKIFEGRLFKSYDVRITPFFVFLLPLFFVLHGYCQHLYFIPVSDVLFLFLTYVVAAGFSFLLVRAFLRRTIESCLVVAFMFSIFFFFGAAQDFLKTLIFISFLSKFSVLLPALLVLFYLGVNRIQKGVPSRLVLYFNSVFIILILIDAIRIGCQIATHKEDKINFIPCASCKRPDVYFLLLDGYAGQQQLVKDFSFSNERFLDQLSRMHFHVLDSSFSNYGDTPFSLSSILNMKYLGLKDYSYSDRNLDYCYEQIANNKTVKFFHKLGYKFVNNSIFDIDGQSAPINKTFLISGKQLITSQTLLGRLERDVYNNIIRKYFPNSILYKNLVFSDLENNKTIYDKTKELAKDRSPFPKFVYSHLLLPHFPYYYNASGQLNPLSSLAPSNLYNDSLYLDYLKYCNKHVLDLIMAIMEYSKEPPIILLMSDHGYRKNKTYSFHSNLVAIHLPNRDYSEYGHNLSNVNQFPLLFNKVFHQKLVTQPDKIEE
jgi:hypothetical protein